MPRYSRGLVSSSAIATALLLACGDDGLTAVGSEITEIPLRLVAQVPLPDPSTLATIEEARIVGDTLRLHVTYAGGCVARHDFGMAAQRSLLESTPPQVIMVLRHDGHEDPCLAGLSAEMIVDLRPLQSLLSEGSVIGIRLYEPRTSTPIDTELVYAF